MTVPPEIDRRMLEQGCAEVFARHPGTGRDGWNGPLWEAIESSGFARVSVPAEHGGEGGTLREAAWVLAVAGEHCVPAPIGETGLLGAWLLGTAGLEVPAGPLTAVAAPPGFTAIRAAPGGPGPFSLTGRLPRVPWGRNAARVAVLAGDRVFSLRREAFSVEPGVNLAGEPRDTLRVDAVVGAADHAGIPEGTGRLLDRRHAFVRIALMAGAARRALASTLRHVTEREQFGRPLSRFQAVQHQVAELAGEVAAMRVAADAAAGVCVACGLEDGRAAVALAAAKVQASRSAGRVARIAHQLHGAIGMTGEHTLGLATTRLWAWREEAGNEAYWARELAELARGAGLASLWRVISG